MTTAQTPKRPKPSFQFYASDVLAEENFRLMGLGERGLLISMMAQMWVNQSGSGDRSIPGDPSSLARLLGLPEKAVRRALTARVLRYFVQQSETGRLTCPELDRQRAEIEEHRATNSANGKKGAEARYGRQRPHDDGAAIGEASGGASGGASGSGIAPLPVPPSRSAIATPEMRRDDSKRGGLLQSLSNLDAGGDERPGVLPRTRSETRRQNWSGEPDELAAQPNVVRVRMT